MKISSSVASSYLHVLPVTTVWLLSFLDAGYHYVNALHPLARAELRMPFGLIFPVSHGGINSVASLVFTQLLRMPLCKWWVGATIVESTARLSQTHDHRRKILRPRVLYLQTLALPAVVAAHQLRVWRCIRVDHGAIWEVVVAVGGVVEDGATVSRRRASTATGDDGEVGVVTTGDPSITDIDRLPVRPWIGLGVPGARAGATVVERFEIEVAFQATMRRVNST